MPCASIPPAEAHASCYTIGSHSCPDSLGSLCEDHRPPASSWLSPQLSGVLPTPISAHRSVWEHRSVYVCGVPFVPHPNADRCSSPTFLGRICLWSEAFPSVSRLYERTCGLGAPLQRSVTQPGAAACAPSHVE